MKVKELIEFLKQFPDQDATVQVLEHESSPKCGSYYLQGGVTEVVDFTVEDHIEYTDFRGNPWVKENCPHYNLRTLLIGGRK